MSYQDLGAWAPGEDPGTLYGDPRLNQRARPGGNRTTHSFSVDVCLFIAKLQKSAKNHIR